MEKILIVDDEEIITESLTGFLSGKGYYIESAETIAKAKEAIDRDIFDLILLDLKLPDGQGIELLDFISKSKEKPIVIMMTAYGTISDAVSAIKKGAYDFIQKPFRTKDIEVIIKLAMDAKRLNREIRELQRLNAEKYGIKSIIGRSEKMQDIFKIVRKIADKGVNSVLIRGESGVGKEVIAKAIHYEGRRSIYPFVAINCSSIPANLLESELYGYEKGAFTDAKEKKVGLLEKANRGTLFLDEIGDMSYELQSKLLRTLEERSIRRLGGTTDINIDIQVIAATNQDLERLIEENRFRKDLYYRLKVIEINIPPLRERKEDIMALAKYFLVSFNSQFNKNIKGFTEEAEKILENYYFPGNVRELRNIIEKICLLEDAEYIGAEQLPSELSGKNQQNDSKFEISKAFSIGLEQFIEGLEKQIIIEALRRSDNNKTEAARLLSMDRSTLRYKMKHYNL